MAYATATVIDRSEIPVIDIGPLRNGQGIESVAEELLQAIKRIGFFYISNHGVPEHVINTARAAAQRFFAYPMALKNEVRINAHHRGFLAVGEAKMYDDARVDLKESFVWGLELEPQHALLGSNPFLTRNQWPSCDPQLKTDIYPYLQHCNDCGQDLLRAFAVAMGIAPNSFIKHFDAPISRASIVYYPAQAAELGATKFGVAPHTDFGCLTILCQDDVGGLQVQNTQDEWVTAHPIEGTLVVNVGDLLQRWSNDIFRSTPHRVVNTSSRSRYSLVSAIDPNFETLIDPSIVCSDSEQIHYPPISCGEAILQRFDRAFQYRHQSSAAN